MQDNKYYASVIWQILWTMAVIALSLISRHVASMFPDVYQVGVSLLVYCIATIAFFVYEEDFKIEETPKSTGENVDN